MKPLRQIKKPSNAQQVNIYSFASGCDTVTKSDSSSGYDYTPLLEGLQTFSGILFICGIFFKASVSVVLKSFFFLVGFSILYFHVFLVNSNWFSTSFD